jgi:hypothetical protein
MLGIIYIALTVEKSMSEIEQNLKKARMCPHAGKRPQRVNGYYFID